MVGLVEDISKVCTNSFKNEGDLVILLGENTDELGGSEYLAMFHGLEAGRPPHLDLAKEKALQQLTLELIAKNYAKSAQDISEGGLSVALAECCIKGNIGVDINLEDKIRPSALLFGEGQSRIIISATKENLDRIKELAFEYHVPFSLIGKVGGIN